MPKITKIKKLKRYPITIFKMGSKSKYFYCRFYVHQSYSKSKIRKSDTKTYNGCYQQSLKITEERKAEQEAIRIYKDFDFTKYENVKTNSKIDFHKDIALPYFKVRRQHKETRYKKELGQYTNEILPVLKDVDYSNVDELETAITEVFYNLKTKGLAVATCRNYKIIISNMCSKALKNNNVPLDVMPEFPQLKGNSIRRLAYSPKETKSIINTFRKEYEQTEDSFYDETADYLCMLKSGGFRPGLELLKVRRNQIGFITDPHNPKTPIMKIALLETKKDRHTLTVADWFRDEVYPNIINRYQNSNSFDYLFFPKAENRDKLFNRIRKNFERISDKIGLYDVNGQKRPIYTFRHSFISNRRSKEVDPNVVAIHSNTSVAMINKHYQDLSDDNLVKIHNQLFPERTRNLNHKPITKKS